MEAGLNLCVANRMAFPNNLEGHSLSANFATHSSHSIFTT
jgi:hypothetical protein